ncbi:MAG TPA: hypothetical protein VM364_03285 [Vicinamibacterales bacterium]|nr:hypothetical protein [Vicinamibacterales bacterium]
MCRGRVFWFTHLLAVAIAVSPLLGQDAPSQPVAATCDPAAIDADSYKLTTEAQSYNALRPREPWWERYGVWKSPREIGDPNEGSTALAEEARRLDDRNLLAHGYLARQYVVLAIDARKAEDAWRRTLAGGGAVTWTATLLEIDPRSFFVVAFDGRGIRLYRFGQLISPLRTHFGVPEFPDPERVEFWRALGGCLPTDVAPEAEIGWGDVRSIDVAGSALRLRLSRKVTVSSDREITRTLDRFHLHLHGQPGDVDFRFAFAGWRRPAFWGRPGGVVQTAYEQRVKQMLVTFFDREGRFGGRESEHATGQAHGLMP